MINHEFTRIDTNERKVLHKVEVFRIIGCAIEVLNGLGHGLLVDVLNYLRTTKLRVGVILNFKRAKLEWERLVL